MDGQATNRSLESISRMAEATAKLRLMKVIDETVATEVMESVKLMQLQYGNIIHTVANPRDVAIEGILNTIRNTTSPITFQEAANTVCKENEQVRSYLIGANNRTLAIENNKRFRDLRERFLEVVGLSGTKIIITSNKPLTLAWLATNTRTTKPLRENASDLSDLSDLEKNTNNIVQSSKTETTFELQQEKSRSVGSVGSVVTSINSQTTFESESELETWGIQTL